MKTSGDDAPPEIVVMRLARLVSVSVGADWSLTWMFGYAFSKALISTVRGSGLVVVIGLAHQVMLPLVAEPVGEDAAAGVDGLLLHAPAVSAAVTPMAVISMTRDLPRIAAITFMVLSFSSLSCYVTRSLVVTSPARSACSAVVRELRAMSFSARRRPLSVVPAGATGAWPCPPRPLRRAARGRPRRSVAPVSCLPCDPPSTVSDENSSSERTRLSLPGPPSSIPDDL